MENLNRYGSQPYDIVMLHGGPGAPGTLSPVARRLSISFGVIEPIMLAYSIGEQIEELNIIIRNNSTIPLIFLGHSWGAWLSIFYAAKYPDMVKKIIMIGAPPFEEKFAPMVHETRISRLTDEEKVRFYSEKDQLYSKETGPVMLSPELHSILTKSDVFEALPNENLPSEFYPEVYKKIWPEAQALRSTGKLLEYVKAVGCQVVAIHGDYDPHPADGVKEPLTSNLEHFRFNLIERCGHYPWFEKYGKDILYKIFYKEMGSTCV
jgi:pimeloyl-ACP methyl ester carboxylesterase